MVRRLRVGERAMVTVTAVVVGGGEAKCFIQCSVLGQYKRRVPIKKTAFDLSIIIIVIF